VRHGPAPRRSRRAAATGGITTIALALIEGRAHGWPAWTWISFALAPILLAGSIAHQRALNRRTLTPLLDLALFRNRAFSAGLATQLLFWSGQAAFFFYFALYLQRGRGLNPLDAGLVFTIAAAAYVIASGATPTNLGRHGRRVILASGLTLAAGHGSLAIAVADNGVPVNLGSYSRTPADRRRDGPAPTAAEPIGLASVLKAPDPVLDRGHPHASPSRGLTTREPLLLAQRHQLLTLPTGQPPTLASASGLRPPREVREGPQLSV